VSESLETLRVEDRDAWRRWLRAHNNSSPGVWILFFKKNTGKQKFTYEEALEEAICMGWIDSIVKRVNEDRYMQKFTPRRPGSDWSLVNRNRARRLQKAGRMMPSGLAVAGPWIHGPEETPPAPSPDEPEIPPVLASALKARKRAEGAFANLPPGERRKIARWVMDAKREETQKQRAAEAAKTLAAGGRLGLK